VIAERDWKPEETFETGMRKTVQWYLENPKGCVEGVLNGRYQLDRLGKYGSRRIQKKRKGII